MIGTNGDADAWDGSRVELGRSLVRAWLEDALIDVDGTVQQLFPPQEDNSAYVQLASRSPSPAADVIDMLGTGGASYARAMGEASQDSPRKVSEIQSQLFLRPAWPMMAHGPWLMSHRPVPWPMAMVEGMVPWGNGPGRCSIYVGYKSNHSWNYVSNIC